MDESVTATRLHVRHLIQFNRLTHCMNTQSSNCIKTSRSKTECCRDANCEVTDPWYLMCGETTWPASTLRLWCYTGCHEIVINHDDVIKWKHFPRYWPFVWGIRRSPVNSPHKGQWRGALMFSLIWAWINGWINNGCWFETPSRPLWRHCTNCASIREWWKRDDKSALIPRRFLPRLEWYCIASGRRPGWACLWSGTDLQNAYLWNHWADFIRSKIYKIV